MFIIAPLYSIVSFRESVRRGAYANNSHVNSDFDIGEGLESTVVGLTKSETCWPSLGKFNLFGDSSNTVGANSIKVMLVSTQVGPVATNCEPTRPRVDCRLTRFRVGRCQAAVQAFQSLRGGSSACVPER